MSITPKGIQGITLDGCPLDVTIKLNLGGITLEVHTEGLHNRVVSEVEKEESPSMTTTNYLPYKVNIKHAKEESPSARDGNPVVSSNLGGSDVRCPGLIFDPVDRVF